MNRENGNSYHKDISGRVKVISFTAVYFTGQTDIKSLSCNFFSHQIHRTHLDASIKIKIHAVIRFEREFLLRVDTKQLVCFLFRCMIL